VLGSGLAAAGELGLSELEEGLQKSDEKIVKFQIFRN